MKQNLNAMKTLHITSEIYKAMAEQAELYGSFIWDCIELENGAAITYAMKNGMPYDVEAKDEEDNTMDHDFSLRLYKETARRNNAVHYDVLGKAWLCGELVA